MGLEKSFEFREKFESEFWFGPKEFSAVNKKRIRDGSFELELCVSVLEAIRFLCDLFGILKFVL